MPVACLPSQADQGGGFFSHKELCVTLVCPKPRPEQTQAGLLLKRQHPPGRAGTGSFQPDSLGDVRCVYTLS